MPAVLDRVLHWRERALELQPMPRRELCFIRVQPGEPFGCFGTGHKLTGLISSQCIPCFAGTWGIGLLGSEQECFGCGAGYYSTTLGGTSFEVCQACASGTFSNDTRAAQVGRDTHTHFHYCYSHHVLCFSATHSIPS